MSVFVDELRSTCDADDSESLPGSRPIVTLPARSQIILAWFNANPLVTPVVGLIAGIMLDEWTAVPCMAACAVFAASALLVMLANRWGGYGYLGLALAGLAVGALMHDLAWRRWPADHLIRCCADGPVTVRVRGTVLSPPMTRLDSGGYPQDAKTRFTFHADQIESESGFMSASGLVSVLVSEPTLALSVGRRVELLGRLRRVSGPANPGCPDFARINRRNGVLVHMSCRRADDVRAIPDVGGWRAWLGRVRCRAKSAMLDDTFPGDVPGSGLLAAMVLGQRSAIDPVLNDAFVRSGTLHYLSVSGAHVGMLVGTVFGVGALFGVSRRRCAILAMITATAYGVLVEPSAPLIRATILTDMGCLALLARRSMRVANWLAPSAIVLLVANPMQLYDAGFQLSFLTLLSIIYLFPRVRLFGNWLINRMLRRDDPLLMPAMQARIGMRQPHPPWEWLKRSFGWYLAMGITAWAVGGLVSAYHFHQFQMWGWFNTPLIAPLIWLAMVLGLAKTMLAAVVPYLAGMLAGPLAWVTNWLIRVVEAMAALPGSGLYTPAIPAGLVWFGMVVVLVWIIHRPLRLSPHFVALPSLIFAIWLAISIAPRSASDTLTMHVLSVGNASATVIELPNGRNLIYDIGSSPVYDVEKWAVGPLLARDHCRRVDTVLLSHANLDHYSGLSELLDRRAVSSVMIPPQFERDSKANAVARAMMSKLKSRQGLLRKIGQGDCLSGTGAATVEVLWPPRDLTVSRSNDDSMVLRVSYADKRILLCGDIEDYALRQLMATTDVRCDVLLLPHHGSVVPSTSVFIRAADPDVCLRSSGRPITESLIGAVAGRKLLSTADSGAIEVAITPKQLIVKP